MVDVFRKQLHQRLLCVKSAAESSEIVEKLKALEQEISALKSSHSPQQKHAVGAAGTVTARTVLLICEVFLQQHLLPLHRH